METTNKQILDACGQSYKLIQEGKRHDDMLRKLEKTVGGKIIHIHIKKNPNS